jgi:hypothetical protein
MDPKLVKMTVGCGISHTGDKIEATKELGLQVNYMLSHDQNVGQN